MQTFKIGGCCARVFSGEQVRPQQEKHGLGDIPRGAADPQGGDEVTTERSRHGVNRAEGERPPGGKLQTQRWPGRWHLRRNPRDSPPCPSAREEPSPGGHRHCLRPTRGCSSAFAPPVSTGAGEEKPRRKGDRGTRLLTLQADSDGGLSWTGDL